MKDMHYNTEADNDNAAVMCYKTDNVVTVIAETKKTTLGRYVAYFSGAAEYIQEVTRITASGETIHPVITGKYNQRMKNKVRNYPLLSLAAA